MENFNPSIINSTINGHPVKHISLVSTMLKRLMDNRNGQPFPGHLRNIIVGGGPIDNELIEQCKSINAPLILSYGMTETCSGITGWRIDYKMNNRLSPAVSAGTVFDNVILEVSNGRLIVSGPMVTKGYLNKPDLAGPLETGDYGCINPDGYVYIHNRREDLIISGGENINPQEITDFLISQPEVSDAAVVGVTDSEWGQTPIAFIVSESNDDIIESLISRCSVYLSSYKVPKKIICLTDIPRNEMGKTDRLKLYQLLSEIEK